MLNGAQMLEHGLAHLQVEFVLELLAALLCAEHFIFHLLQFIGDEPFGVGDCLFAHVMRGNLIEMRPGDLDEITKHIVEAHLQ